MDHLSVKLNVPSHNLSIKVVTDYLSLKSSSELTVAINIQGSKLSVAKSTV